MDPLSITAAVLAIGKSLATTIHAVRWVISLKDVPLELVDLQNELQTVHGYMGILQPIMDSLKMRGGTEEQSRLAPTMEYIGTILKRLETDLESLQKVMDTLGVPRSQIDGGNTDNARRWLRVKWKLKKNATALHRDRVCVRRVELAQAVGLLQSSLGLNHSVLLLDIQEVTRKGFRDVSGLLAATTKTSHPSCVEDSTPSIPTSQLGSSTESEMSGPRESNRGMVSVSACLETRRAQHCHCQCHSRREARTGDLFTRFVGQVFLNYSSIPYWDPRPGCDKPDEQCGCINNGGTRSIRLNYIFPEWLFRKAIYLSATWETLYGSGASLHLRIARVIPYSHTVWAAVERNATWKIQAMIDSKDILPTDIDAKGNTLFYHSRAKRNSTGSQAETFQLPLKGYVYDPQSGQRSPWVLSGLAHRQITPYPSPDNANRQLQDYCTVHALSDRGADDNEDDLEAGENIKTTALHDAIIYSVNATAEATESTLNTLGKILSRPSTISIVNAHDSVGYTPLHWAAYFNNAAAIRLLLNHGADIRAQDISGNTPLFVALLHGYADCATLLMKHLDPSSTAVDDWTNMGNRRGIAPLFPAARNADIPFDLMVTLLVRLGKDSLKAKTTAEGWSVIHFMVLAAGASGFQNPEQISLMKRKMELICGAGVLSVDGRDNKGQSPLMLVLRQYDDPVIVKVLLNCGADVTLSDIKGGTVLHYLARYATGRTMDVFLEDLEQSEPIGGRRMEGKRLWLGGMKPDMVACIAASNESEEEYEKHGRTPEEYFKERRRGSTHEGLGRDGVTTTRPVTENDVASFERLLRRIREDAGKDIGDI